MSKLKSAALVVAFLALLPSPSALAQDKVKLKVPSGVAVKDSKKAQMQANYHLNEGDTLREKGKFKEALAEYKLAMKACPNDADVYKNLGGTFAQLGQWDEAEETLKQGTSMYPKDWLMWNNYAVVLLNLKKNDACKTAIKRALALNPPSYKAEEMQMTLKQLEPTTKFK